MRCVILLSGNIQCGEPILGFLQSADYVICADGGIRHARRLNWLPDMVVGDLDSVTEADLAWAETMKIPIRRYPVAKNETDAELAVQAALERLPEPPGQHEIILGGALGDRPDHVLATQLLAVRYAAKGWRFVLTDGSSFLYTLSGPQTLTLGGPPLDQGPSSQQHQGRRLAVSVIPIGAENCGITYEGLAFPLDNAGLPLGSTRGMSNYIIKYPAAIHIVSGLMLVVVTPE